MIKKLVAFGMIAHLLLGSIILPLGDFSLLNQLPRMYQEYEKVVSPDDNSILDFVGDYLLGGKDLLGHNQHDRPLKAGEMQFQHPAIFAVTIQPAVLLSCPLPVPAMPICNTVYVHTKLSYYHSSVFRPPLA